MNFFLSKSVSDFSDKYFRIVDFYLYYRTNQSISERELLIENDSQIILGDTNPSIQKLISNNPSHESIEQNISCLNNGYILYVNKVTETIILYTDIFGFYQVFYHNNEENISVSSDYNALLSLSNKKPNEFAILDIILFNYTLFERTLIADILRISGGTKALIQNGSFTFEVCNNYAQNFKLNSTINRISSKTFAECITSSIEKEVIQSKPLYISMTAGFDSRAILASCNKSGYLVQAVSYGRKGNIEEETLRPFINQFVQKHHLIELNEEYLKLLPEIFNSYLKKNSDNPVFHNLVEYEYYNNFINDSNLIAGFMGGELINGQSLGAQVTFTQFAANLLRATNIEELKELLLNRQSEVGLLRRDYIERISDEYLNTLKPYLYESDNLNLLNFIVNEEFAKFFGAANKVFKDQFNLVVPFMNAEFLDFLLNSQISFLRKNLFTKSPFRNFKSKVLYARAIRHLNPALSNTKFDRLYRVKDLDRFYLWPKAAFYYFLVHAFHKSNKMFKSTTRYDIWFQNLLLPNFLAKKYTCNICTNSLHLNKESYNNLNSLQKREILRLCATLKVLNEF